LVVGILLPYICPTHVGAVSVYSSQSETFVGFEVLTLRVMKSSVFWDIMLCNLFNRLHGVISQKIELFISNLVTSLHCFLLRAM
jgi:hypothetical protein